MTGVVTELADGSTSASPGTWWWCPAGRPTRRSCCWARQERRPSTRDWPTVPTRWVATTCATTTLRSWRCPERPTTPACRRRSPTQRLVPEGRGLGLPVGGIQMLGKPTPSNPGRWPPLALGGEADAPRVFLEDAPRATGSTSGCRRKTCQAPTPGLPLTGTGPFACLYSPRTTTSEGLTSDAQESSTRCWPTSGFHKESHQRGVYLHEGMNIAATAHQAGTARFGADAADSVLDVNCKAHELGNLYVVDSSFFLSRSARSTLP